MTRRRSSERWQRCSAKLFSLRSASAACTPSIQTDGTLIGTNLSWGCFYSSIRCTTSSPINHDARRKDCIRERVYLGLRTGTKPKSTVEGRVSGVLRPAPSTGKTVPPYGIRRQPPAPCANTDTADHSHCVFRKPGGTLGSAWESAEKSIHYTLWDRSGFVAPRPEPV
ncbi:hypothetical protein OH77DRAFT_1048166 [Trametes cingulata]|nr:hypothetical protein OH77DRAFT_1048166 [Trametes cingulata]